MTLKAVHQRCAERLGRQLMLQSAWPFYLGLLFYGVFISRNLSIAHDSVDYLLGALNGERIWSANHLLAVPLQRLALSLGDALSLPFSLITLATLPSVIGGAWTLQMVYLFLRHRLGLSNAVCAPALLAIGCSFGVWYYSATIEAYAVPIALIFSVLYLLSDPDRGRRTFILASLVHALAALFHQYAILVAPLVLYSIFSARALPRLTRFGILIMYTLITAVLVSGGLALGAKAAGVSSLTAFLPWLLGNATDPNAQQFIGGLDLRTLLMAVVGFARALIGGHFAFAVPELEDVFKAVFAGSSLRDEIFLVAGLGENSARLLLAASLAWGLLLLYALVRALPAWRQAASYPALRHIALLLLPMTLFFTFYFGHNIELWIVQSICFWMLLVWSLAQREQTRVLAALAGGLLLINFAGTMHFARQPSRDYHQWQLAGLPAALDDGDVVVIGDWWPTEHFIKLFLDRQPVVLSREFMAGTSVDALVEALDKASGRVLLYGDIFDIDPPVILTYGPGYVDYLEAFTAHYDIDPVLDPDSGRGHRFAQPQLADTLVRDAVSSAEDALDSNLR